MYNDYTTWRERAVIADCLRDLGYTELAQKAVTAKQETVEKYLSIIEAEATKRNHGEIIERLCFAGLIYG
jgi:hypothetical protein